MKQKVSQTIYYSAMVDALFHGTPHLAGLQPVNLQLYHLIFCVLRYNGRHCFFLLQSKSLLISRIYQCDDVIQRSS